MIYKYHDRFIEKIIPVTESGCWIWVGAINSSGYGSFQFKDKIEGAHRVSWKLFKGDIPEGMFVCHKCDVRCCVNPYHLFIGTNYDNMKDMAIKGRAQHGEGRKNHKLTKENIIEIRNSKLFNRELAEIFGVSITQITLIKNRKKWRNVQ